MRILAINYEYPPIGGGGGFVTKDILEHMARSGHSVSIITSQFEGLKKHEKVNGVEVLRVPVLLRKKMEVANIPSMLSYFPSSVIRSIPNLLSRTYDIINTHFAVPSGPTGHLLSKLFHVPNVLAIHGGDIFDPSKSLSPHKVPLLRDAVRFMLNRADRVVAQSNDTRRNAYKYYDVKQQIDIIPLGIKKPNFEKKTRYDFGLSRDEIVFSTIGRLVKRKNIDDALAVLSGIKGRYKFKFFIIGEGPERAHLEELIRSFGLKDMVYLMGNVSDEVKFQVLDLSDCYLSTALHEGFGLVFLEAMECGLPVICYNRGGQNDFLVNGETGFLVELGDRKSFSEKTIELMTDSKLKKNISSYNRNLVKNYYISTCAEKYISLFQSVISTYRQDRKFPE